MAIHWASRGMDAAKQFDKEEKSKKMKQEQSHRMWRFWLKSGEEARITFIDGALDENGVLDVLVMPQHQVHQNGSWNNFYVCTDKQEPCPICEGNDTPALVALFTIIDHRKSKSKDGQTTYKDQKRLFVAKHDTYKILQNMAAKRGGLAGMTVDALRTGDKSAAVGNTFDFIEKNDPEELAKLYTKKDEHGKVVTDFVPADYEKEIPYLTAKELRALGFGGAPPVGHHDSYQSKAPSTDYDSQL